MLSVVLKTLLLSVMDEHPRKYEQSQCNSSNIMMTEQNCVPKPLDLHVQKVHTSYYTVNSFFFVFVCVELQASRSRMTL